MLTVALGAPPSRLLLAPARKRLLVRREALESARPPPPRPLGAPGRRRGGPGWGLPTPALPPAPHGPWRQADGCALAAVPCLGLSSWNHPGGPSGEAALDFRGSGGACLHRQR